MEWLEYILIHYRWIIVILFLLPASFLYDLWYYARSWVVFQLNSAPGNHDQKVQYVQQQVREWIANGRKERMCTARPGWQTISFREGAYKKTLHKISINMIDIIKIDTANKVVVCEPLVTMGQLTQTLTALGWTIPVVPEMDDLTIGGLVMGTGIETSSHRVGLFQHICRAFELVLADASVVTCSEKENPDLFYSVPWSYGTLGLLTAVHIDIIPAQRFVRVEYLPCHSLDDMVSTFTKETQREDACDFVEGIMFSLDEGIVMRANMCTSAEPGKVNPIGRWYKPWFFRHIESFLDLHPVSDSPPIIEYLPLRDYYHRHTRSIFWELQDIIPFGNHPLFRYSLGWLVPPKVSLLKLTQGQTVKKLYEENHFIQDMLVPLSALKEALHVFEEQVKIYPLWLCPFLLPSRPGMLRAPGDKETMFVDIGSYGIPKVDNFLPIETTRRVEEFVRSVKGFQMMYADSFMTREEYRQMFDHTLYDRLRHELECDHAFPEVYDKVNRKARI